jgi:hypothetical protein
MTLAFAVAINVLTDLALLGGLAIVDDPGSHDAPLIASGGKAVV